jgi:uncharacterized membrane protein
MRPPQNPIPSAAAGNFWTRTHWLSTFLLAAAFACALARFFIPVNSNWPEALFILLAAAGTLSVLARKLPLQNVLLAALIIALIGGGISAIGAGMGIPFGPFIFGGEFGPQLFNRLPWAMPLLWIVAVLNSRGVARLILRPWRKTKTYGFWLIGAASALVLLFDLALDPFASRVRHYWLWEPTKFPVTWQGAPLANFLSWGFVTLLILAFATPALVKKRPGQRSSPDFFPLGIWLGAILIFGIAAGMNGLWPAVALDAAIGVITAIFAIRGGRW